MTMTAFKPAPSGQVGVRAVVDNLAGVGQGFYPAELAVLFDEMDQLCKWAFSSHARSVGDDWDEQPPSPLVFQVTSISLNSPLEVIVTISAALGAATAIANRILSTYQRVQAIQAEHARQERDKIVYRSESAIADLGRLRAEQRKELLEGLAKALDDDVLADPEKANDVILVLNRIRILEMVGDSPQGA